MTTTATQTDPRQQIAAVRAAIAEAKALCEAATSEDGAGVGDWMSNEGQAAPRFGQNPYVKRVDSKGWIAEVLNGSQEVADYIASLHNRAAAQIALAEALLDWCEANLRNPANLETDHELALSHNTANAHLGVSMLVRHDIATAHLHLLHGAWCEGRAE